jgi:4-hydroxy-4-methyl-2-oxoglutarate aldolase
MFVLNDMPAQVDAALLKKLAGVETATIGHFQHAGFMHPHLRAVIPEHRITGTAVTVRIPGPDSALLHHVMGLVRPGDFVVIDRCGDVKHACWGGVVTRAAKHRGVVGAVVDGYATDFTEVRETDMPLWCLGPTPITTKKLALDGQLNVPVSCGGVTVHPGDAILADESGVIVLDPADVEAVANRALGMQELEPKTVGRILAGEKMGDVTGATKMIEDAIAAQSG